MGDSSDFGGKLDDSAAVELTGKIMVAAIIVLFLVVVMVLFLHLYAKWFWWRVEDASHPSRDSRHPRRRRRFVFVPGQDPAAAALRRGLDASVLGSLPVVIFRPEEFKDGLECAVCLSELAAGEKARMLPQCNHGFHVDCIDMWFQSHSTCPLCRNPVAPDSPSDVTSLDSPQSVGSAEESSGGVGESPNFPTNVLFWGNQTQVSSGVLSLEEGPSQSPASSSSFSPPPSSSSRPDGMLVIDIPRQMTDNFSSSSPSAIRFAEEDPKSPMPTRLRSLKRLLSRERRVAPCSPTSVDAEQGGVGRG
ncbi:hypothetical protein L1049_004354 [Liquidambar formosana]|uniref:RING-type E3 ubiquitin transferase n=1 Tax=Liquidambar formosana TaxID=63359 RepID=A0AAP0WW29_LIQFO